ncbi:hypothetical protein SUSAZ_07245 [Sulfolobus acidocaldarius SUSAZ]|nr:hypothetical protein SUSAZ_07245 [Sulfolobus acidocaldarius SUSAZ]
MRLKGGITYIDWETVNDEIKETYLDPLDKVMEFYVSSGSAGGIPHSGPAGI